MRPTMSLWDTVGLDASIYEGYLKEMTVEEAVEYLEDLGVRSEDATNLVDSLYASENTSAPTLHKATPVWTPEQELPDVKTEPVKKKKKEKEKALTISGNSLGKWLNAKAAPKNPHDAAISGIRTIGSYQIVDEDDESFVCGVCLDVSRNPVLLDCNGGHIACAVCWTQMVSAARVKSLEVDVLATSNVENTKRPINCPLCKQFVPIEAIPLSETTRWEKYQCLKLFCDREECDWKGCLNEYDAHRDWCGVEETVVETKESYDVEAETPEWPNAPVAKTHAIGSWPSTHSDATSSNSGYIRRPGRRREWSGYGGSWNEEYAGAHAGYNGYKEEWRGEWNSGCANGEWQGKQDNGNSREAQDGKKKRHSKEEWREKQDHTKEHWREKQDHAKEHWREKQDHDKESGNLRCNTQTQTQTPPVADVKTAVYLRGVSSEVLQVHEAPESENPPTILGRAESSVTQVEGYMPNMLDQREISGMLSTPLTRACSSAPSTLSRETTDTCRKYKVCRDAEDKKKDKGVELDWRGVPINDFKYYEVELDSDSD